MVNALNLLQEARSLGSTKTLADVKAEIATHDYATLKAEARSKYEIIIWDKVSPINGATAEVVLARPDYQHGEIYLIKINGQIVYLQPHDPNGGPLETVEEALEVANRQVDTLCEMDADAQIRQAVLEALL